MKIGHGVAAYQVDEDTTILISIKHAIIGGEEQSTTLLCPNHLRNNGVELDSCPFGMRLTDENELE